MLNFILVVFSIYGLTHLFRDNSGPFGILSKIRNALMQNKYIGVFVFGLLDCVFCISCWSGAIVYFLFQSVFNWKIFMLWILMGGSIGLVMETILNRLNRE